MKKPAIRIVSGPSPMQKAFAEATLAGTASFFSALSKAADLHPHDESGLFQVLHFRCTVAQNAANRSRWFGGRWYNKLSGEDPEYVPLSGTHLKQALEIYGFNAPDFVVTSGKYELRTDIATEVSNILKGRLENETQAG